jgi:hypothetical protein
MGNNTRDAHSTKEGVTGGNQTGLPEGKAGEKDQQ